MRTVDFFFDLSCPWSYLALVRLRDATERNGARIEFRPICVDTLLATENPQLQQTRLSAIPAHAEWQRRDLQQWAEFWGLRLQLPAGWPFPAKSAAAAMCAAERLGKGMAFALAVFRACFGEGANIRTRATLLQCAADAGLQKDAFATELDAAENEQTVQANTLELIRRGGFGTPTMFVDDELFFGNDRVPLVEWTLGPIGDAEFVIPGQHSKI
jgi:2-hydroxychromene-2-carboxylate isomerase